jgi:TPR repeat protein
MKKSVQFLILIATCAFCVFSRPVAAQSLGLGAPAGLFPEPTPQEKAQLDYQAKVSVAGNNIFRVVNGRIYNVLASPDWKIVIGKVNHTEGDLLLLTGEDTYRDISSKRALKNYGGDGSVDKQIYTVAIRVGTHNWNDVPLELWDCGIPYVAPPPTPEQIKAAQEAAKVRAIADKKKAMEAQANAVRWLQSQATNGDASAQCSLGEHYLAGIGCETNREQGIYWLKQASAQGDIEASNKLSTLAQ